MVGKHLEEIRSKEEEAGRRIADARARAVRIVESAGEEGQRLLEDKRIEEVELRKKMIAGANDSAGAMIEKLRVENRRRLEELESRASGGRRKALDLIMDAFRKGLRNRDVRV